MGNSRFLLFFVCIFFVQIVTGQDFKYGYLVEFADKNNSFYTIENPLEYLSQRAIDRRLKNSIEITSEDFPINKNYVNALIELDAKFHGSSRWFNSAVFLTNNEFFESDAMKHNFVNKVTLVYRGNAKKTTNRYNKWQTNDDSLLFGESYNQIVMCNAQKMHKKGFTGKGIHIAVLDGGFYKVNELGCFENLYKNGQILSHWDFVDRNNDVFDDHTHGMSVLSTMGGMIQGELIGTAPGASYHLFRTENVDTEYLIEEENWIAGAEAADSAGADIITASLGYSEFDDDIMNHSYSDMDGKTTRISIGAEIAFSKGLFVVNSAGNEGNKDWKYLTAPSDGENVLCVGAVTADKTLAAFSGIGPSADGRIKPDVMAKGVATTIIKSKNEVSSGNGTSYSCPVMAGMVACLWQAFPEYSNAQLLQLVRSLGDRYQNPDNYYGFGVPDFGKAMFLADSVGFNQPKSNQLVKVYPNPFSHEISFHLYIKKEGEVEFSLYDAMGRNIYNQIKEYQSDTYNLVEIKGLTYLNKGYYILKAKTNDGILTKKVIKY